MITRFLPRQIGSVETGPQMFIKTEVPNTTFIFSHLLDSVSSVSVQNGGYGTLNQVFNYITQLNNKPYYNVTSNSNLFIVYFSNAWGIYDFELSSEPVYFSTENVMYPWMVTNWQVTDNQNEDWFYPPAPNVSQVI